ncbi:MAG TPA: TolC family protein [Geobacteraceae bacterium]
MLLRVMIICLVTLAGLLMPVILPAGDRPVAESLPELVREALSKSEELKSNSAHVAMLESRARLAGAWDDPMLMFKIQNGIVTDPLNFNRDSMTQKVIGVNQQLPFWGKRDLKREVAAREAEYYHWSHEDRRREIARSVKEYYFQLYAIDKSLYIVGRNLKLAEDFVTLAETKYTVGQGVQQDIFKAQLERSKLLEMQLSLEQQRRTLQANLNGLLFRQPDQTIGAIADFELPKIAQSREELQQLADEHRPLLRSYLAQQKKGLAAGSLARRENYPDFTVSLEYMQRDPAMGGSGEDMYSLGVTFNLPLQRVRREAMAAEAAAEAGMATAELRNLRNSIASGIGDLLGQLEQRRKLAELYQSGIIPQAEKSLESAIIGYRVNKVDFLTLLDSRGALFNYERAYFDTIAEYRIRLAQLEALVGTELTDAGQDRQPAAGHHEVN